MILTEAQYYKLKFRLAEGQINRQRAQEITTLVDKQYLDAKSYRLDDKTFEATEVAPE